uniref:uncharacterized protein isoform X3 n=1 Tax=Myxine glutinosa TaxID=7769 RepID=UPI00358E5FC2
MAATDEQRGQPSRDSQSADSQAEPTCTYSPTFESDTRGYQYFPERFKRKDKPASWSETLFNNQLKCENMLQVALKNVHIIREMEDPERLRREYLLAVLQHQHDLIDLTLYQLRANRARRRRGERRRRNWLMVELRNEDEQHPCSMQHHPSTVKLIVKACLILHNLMRTRYPGLQNQQLDRAENENRDLVPGAWREGHHLEDTQTATGPNTASKDGKKQRNLLKHWVNSPAGAVPWQDRMI